MPISGPATVGNDVITVTPTGFYSVNFNSGEDTLVMNYSALMSDIGYRSTGYGNYQFTDYIFSGIEFYSVEHFDLTGGSGNDSLVGLGNSDTLTGGAGSDTLVSGLGSDVLDGGAGYDRWVASYGTLTADIDATLLAGGAISTIAATGATVRNVEALTMTTGHGNDVIDTTAVLGNDNVTTGVGDDRVALGRGQDTADGGAGTDTLVMDWGAISDSNDGIRHSYESYSWQRFASDSGDELNYYGFEKFDLTGGAGRDYLRGAGLNDTLSGGAANDTLNGGAGADEIHGGGGKDLWIVDTSAQTTATSLNLNTDSNSFGVTFDGIERVEYTGGSSADDVAAKWGQYDDVINTGLGNDTVSTSRGRDVTNGGDGTDLLVMDWGGLTDARDDIAHSFDSYSWRSYASASGERVDFYGYEQFNLTGGAGFDDLYGGALNDTLIGNAGNDTLRGGAGVDVIDGGAGTDLWVLDNSARTKTTYLNINQDTTNTGATFSSIERLDYTGGSTNDRVTARWGEQNDTINGGGGNDTILAGRGQDIVNGGDGTDLMIMNWSALTDPMAGIVHSNESYSWQKYQSEGGQVVDFYGIERFKLLGGAGRDDLHGAGLNDTLIGNDGNDTLRGGAGSDAIDGGAGVDLWQVDTSARATTTFLNVGTSWTNAGATFTGIERIDYTGGDYNDKVTALAGAYDDVFNTGGGADTVVSGRGQDIANGGAGTDLLIMDWSALSGARSDIAHSYESYSWRKFQSASGDMLDFYGFEQFNLAGGAGNDHFVGGNQSDTLAGNNGDDVLDGVSGNDVINGGAGVDHWIADVSGFGAISLDLAASQSSAQMTANGFDVRNIEQITLTTSVTNDTVSTSGYANNDSISTGDGNDTVDAGLGQDSVNGGAGTDTLVVDYSSMTDAVSSETLSYGWVRLGVDDTTTYVQHLGFEQFDITGGSGRDTLNGADLNDRLKGLDGDDMLIGGAGQDTILGGAGDDTWNGNYADESNDLTLVLNSFGTGTLGGVGTAVYQIENVQLITGTGNDSIDTSAKDGNDNIKTGLGDDTVNVGMGHHDTADGDGGTDMLVADFGLAQSGVTMSLQAYSWWQAASANADYVLDFTEFERVDFSGSGYNDHMNGFGAADTLRGNGGTDILDGGAGNDVLYGGADQDVFVFTNVASAGVDTIMDAAASDVIQVSGESLNSLAVGSGAAVLEGEVQFSASGGMTQLYVGTDTTAGYDLQITLDGTYGLADMSLFSGSLLFV